jgi:hypothetical protein
MTLYPGATGLRSGWYRKEREVRMRMGHAPSPQNQVGLWDVRTHKLDERVESPLQMDRPKPSEGEVE